jgi:DNA-directed RNA polymerase subunit RPC12/RpoP
MPFVAARCPQCGGDLQLDNQKETGFCMHCGSKIVVQEAIKAVRIDNTHMIETWMNMGDLAVEAGNNDEACSYYTKVIEVQTDNWLAIYKKGKAVGWQSTLANVRFTETTTLFGQAINIAPENEKDKLKEMSAEELRKLASALISLRAERFIKWPDEDEANGFLGDINNILNAVFQLKNKSGFVVTGFMEPIASIITTSVVAAWSDRIKPDYVGDENRPGKFEFDQFIERIGYCTMLIKQAIEMSENDDKEDIHRYEILIMLHKEAIDSCSWDYEIYAWGKDWKKEYQLTNEAKRLRLNEISDYNNQISQIKIKIQQQEKVEREEKERKEIEEANKRYEGYWSAHIKEKAQFESEKSELSDQIANLVKERETLCSPLLLEGKNIQARIAKLRDEYKKLGLLKGKEKKALQKKIDDARNDLAKNNSRIKELQSPIMDEIEGLSNRINKIDSELTMAR